MSPIGIAIHHDSLRQLCTVLCPSARAKDTRDTDLDCFSQHLRSGYPEVYRLIEEYLKFTSEKGSKNSIRSNFAVYQEEADYDHKDLKEERKRIKKIDDLKALLVKDS